MKTMTIGVTGPSGAGKSTLTKYFSHVGIPTLDADSVYHSLLESSEALFKALTCEFGNDIIESGKISRPLLREKVFSDGDGERLRRLNSITHEFVLREIREFLSTCNEKQLPFAVIDVPLLIECGLAADCDYVISVLSDREKRIERIMERDSLTEEEAEARIKVQKPDSFYIEGSNRIIYNNGNAGAVEIEFMKLASRLGIGLGGEK